MLTWIKLTTSAPCRLLPCFNMFRQALRGRMHMYYMFQQQPCNLQWVPTVLEASTVSTRSTDRFSGTEAGLKGGITNQQRPEHIYDSISPAEPALLWQHPRSSQVPARREGCSSPLSTLHSSQSPCAEAVSTVHSRFCRGWHKSACAATGCQRSSSGSGSSSNNSRTSIQHPTHRVTVASTAALVVTPGFQRCKINSSHQHRAESATAGCQTSRRRQKPCQRHVSSSVSNCAVLIQSPSACSSVLRDASNSLSAIAVESSRSRSHFSSSAGQDRHNNSHKPQHEHHPDSEKYRSFVDADAGSTDTRASSSSHDSFNIRANHSVRSQQQHQHNSDLRSPAGWYPLARAMRRQLIAHVGPTNSGKTHAALAALMAAGSGVYCGPLRLLACEIADRLNAAGVPCNLVTGQEVRMVGGARHTACTVEMADLDQRVEVAVLDEIQMISDKSRGWSWTRALLGLPAHSLHVCGDPAATALITQLAQHCSDQLTVNRYRRLSPLVVEPQALPGLQAVQEGDCVVAFGRKVLHKLRKGIIATSRSSAPHDRSEGDVDSSSEGDGAASRHGVGMVYGALPPEARRTQAALFNAGAHQWPRYSVMVASDAIGMGLNLNIRRIVFASMHKYDGEELRRLTPSEVKQIAGRAGRYGSAHGAAGYVSCLNEEDLPLLREALGTASTHNTHACLLPRFEQLEQFQLSLKHPLPFHKVLSKFATAAQLSAPYFLADMSNIVSLARVLSHLEADMDLEEMYTWCISPAGADDPAVLQALLAFATLYVEDRRVTPDCITYQITAPPRSAAEMKAAEELFRIHDLYLWLAGRVGPGVFQRRKFIRQQRQQVAELINVALQEMGGVLGSKDWQVAGAAAGRRAGRGAAVGGAGKTGRVRRDTVGRTSWSCSEEDEAEFAGG